MGIEELKGITLSEIGGMEAGSEEIIFRSRLRPACNLTAEWRMWHDQDCCESVSVNDVCGDPSDLIGTPILEAYEDSNAEWPAPENPDSYTWTFYVIATIKGSVTIRWLGESNGYYSESVSFAKVK